MTETERYLKAKEIFFNAIERDVRDRESYVAGACAGDEILHQEVLRFLRGDFQADDTWEKTLRFQIAEQLNTPEPPITSTYPIGETFGGRYFIEGALGQGGMGAIYLAKDRKSTRLN